MLVREQFANQSEQPRSVQDPGCRSVSGSSSTSVARTESLLPSSKDSSSTSDLQQPSSSEEVQVAVQEHKGCFHFSKTLFLVGGSFIFGCVNTNFTILSSSRLQNDIPGMTKVVLGICEMLFWVGWIVSSAAILPFVDSCGRKKPTYIFLLLGLGAAALTTCASQVWVFGLGLFLLGLFYTPSSLTAAIFMQESVPDNRRSLIMSVANVMYSILNVAMAVGCSYTQTWSWRLETRLWYSPLLIMLLLGPILIKEQWKEDGSASQNAVGYASQLSALFRSPLLCNMLATLLCWFAVSLTFFGLSYSSGDLTTNLYVSMALLGGMDVIAYLVSIPIIACLGTRNTQSMCFVMAGIALLCCCFVTRDSRGAVICALIGRFFTDIAFTTVYLLIVDCFPEANRASAIGMANVFGRLGSTIAPYSTVIPFAVLFVVLSVFNFAAALATRVMKPSYASGVEQL